MNALVAHIDVCMKAAGLSTGNNRKFTFFSHSYFIYILDVLIIDYIFLRWI